MSRREKIILVLTLGVAAYGLLNFTVLSKMNGTAESAVKKQALKAATFAEQAMARISKLEPALKQAGPDTLTAIIESDWETDPFFRDTEPLSGQAGSQADLVYSGYISAGRNVFAVINGMEYKTGETIVPGGQTVTRITPRKVVLRLGNREMSLSLAEE